jgi:CheY-like chemotaxis protein
MQAISLFQDALARTNLSTEQERISDYLAQSTQSLSEMLDALLDISKLDAGAVEVSSEIIQAVTLMQRIDAEFSPMAAKKSLRFKLCFAFRDVAIITDTKLLMSLLGNLIGNAIKYTQQGGVLVSIRRRGPEALIQVWDTGIGISPEHLDTIYDEYFQIGNPERDRANGLGLGLAIAQRLGSLLGTKLVCRSRPGKGSVFEFRVPLASCGERETPNRIDPPAVGNVANLVGRRVVLVEDDLTVATAMTLTLESFGMTVTRYRTAEEALADSAIAEADIYIADLRLPGLSGVEFLNVVQQRAAKPIRAVVVTGDTAIDRIEMMRSTSWRVLFKPVELSSLLSAIGLQESAH